MLSAHKAVYFVTTELKLLQSHACGRKIQRMHCINDNRIKHHSNTQLPRSRVGYVLASTWMVLVDLDTVNVVTLVH